MTGVQTCALPILPLKTILSGVVIIALLGGFVYLFYQQKQMEAKHIPQPVEIDPEAEEKLKQLQNADKDFQKKIQTEVQAFFKKSGWLDNGKMLPLLLDYKVMKRQDMQKLLFNSTDNPRLKPIYGVYRKKVRGVTPLESKLWGMLHGADYPDFDVAKVQERQRYWRSRNGDSAQMLKEMLTTDPVMQVVALDAVIRHGINKVLEHGAFRDNEEAELKNLLYLRLALLDPEWGKLQFMSKNLH